jgi:hypothetical protein
MSVKRLLYIDDNKIDSQIENLRKKLKRSGIELVETFLNLGDDKFKIRNGDNGKIVLNIPIIKDYITLNLLNESFDIVASDYDYSDDSLDGYSLLKWIMNVSRSQRLRIRRAKFCLYSAQQDKLVERLDSPAKIKELVKLKIDDFINRDNLSKDLTSIFTKEKENYVFPEHIVKYLEKFPEQKFRNTFPKFKEKTLSEIAHEIDKDLPNGVEFQKYIVELTVAHLIELNNFPKE